MSHVETIAIHFVGYNLLHGAVNEVSGSLRLVRDLSNQTGLTMTQWNQRITATTNQLALAHARYADLARTVNPAIVSAAHDQALAIQRLEAAHMANQAAIIRETKALADLELIASRTYTDAERADLNTAANNRLAAALGERAIAAKEAQAATIQLAEADRVAGTVASEAALKQAIAADTVIVAQERQTAAVRGATMAQIGYLRSASGAAMGLGAGILVGTGIAVAGLAYATSKASQFTGEVNLLHTQARVAIANLPVLSAGMLSMAGQVGFSADELAKALYLIESVSGGSMTAAHALDELRAAAMGAAVGHADLIQTANALASVMAVYPGIVNGAAGAMGQLDAIVGQGKMTMEDLNGALRTGVLATLQSAHISLGDFGGALATMTDYGIPAIQAANSLRMAIYLMTAPTMASDKILKIFGLTVAETSSASKKFSDAFADAGIRHAKLADDLQKPGGIILALQHLRREMITAGLDAQGQAEVIYKAFGGGKMGKAVLTLYENIAGGARASDAELSKLGFTTEEIATLHDRLINKTALVNKQINLLGTNFQFLLANDPSQLWKNFTASIDALIVSLGEAFIPDLMAILGFITPIVSSIAGWIGAHKELVGTLLATGLALAAVFGTALIFIGAIGMIVAGIVAIASASSVVVPVTALVFGGMIGLAGLVTAAVLLISKAWGSMSDLWDYRVVPTAHRLANIIGTIWTVLQEGLRTAKPLFDAVFSDLETRLTAQGGIWDNLTQAFLDFTDNLIAFVKSPDFASLIADFAVGLPVAIGLAVDALFLFVDSLQLAFTYAVGAAKVAMDMLSGHLDQIPGDVQKTADELAKITKRMGDDQDKMAKDQAALVDGTYEKQWNDVYNTVMKMTAKIGTDGSMAITNAGDHMAAAQVAEANKLEAASYSEWNRVGEAMVMGALSGISQHEQALHAAEERMIMDAVTTSKRVAEMGTPSRLMAREVGVPLAQGIEMGFVEQMPIVHRRIGAMVFSLSDQRVSAPPIPTISVVNPTRTSMTEKKIDTSRLEELMAEANTILSQIRDDSPQIDSYAAQKRVG